MVIDVSASPILQLSSFPELSPINGENWTCLIWKFLPEQLFLILVSFSGLLHSYAGRQCVAYLEPEEFLLFFESLGPPASILAIVAL